jgi:hypothetical protein
VADARAILNASQRADDVLMIGAGLVGLETGYALEKKAKNARMQGLTKYLRKQPPLPH